MSDAPSTLSGVALFCGPPWPHDRAVPTIWVYRLSNPNWQQAVLTSDGMFAVTSDYGNYARNWINWGEGDFRAFFGKISGNYLLRKINVPHDEFREEKTEKNLRAAILEAYRSQSLTKADLREVLDLLHEADLSCIEGVEAFFRESLSRHDSVGDALDCEAWDGVIDHGPAYDLDAVNYCEKLLPVLQARIQDQLAAEAPAARLIHV